MDLSNVKLIDSTVFDSFNTLHSGNQTERIAGSVKLLQHLKKNDSADKKIKEREYTIKRLIRGLGSTTCASRTGFFSTLVSYLSIDDSPSIQDTFTIMNKELNVGKEISTKEESDALTGQILLCGALIRCGKIFNATDADIEQCVNVLVRSSKHKSFHASLSYTFLIDLLKKFTEHQFVNLLWPSMKNELTRSWEKHSINTIHFLLATKQKYPDTINSDFLLKSIKTEKILTALSYKHFARLFWSNKSIAAVAHPAYDALSNFLMGCSDEQLIKFWSSEINELLAAPNKVKEVVTLRILTDILSNEKSIASANLVRKLISKRFIKMITTSLKENKSHHEYISSLYNEFFESLTRYFGKVNDDEVKFQIIQKCILYPGHLLIEKFASHKLIHQLATKLEHTGLCKLIDLYKDVLLGNLPKNNEDPNSTWLNIEKQHAVYMLQYLLSLKSANVDVEWRSKQMVFLLSVSLFYCSTNGEPVKKIFDKGTVTKELAINLRNVFFSSLQSKLANLKDEKRLLFNVASFINQILDKKSVNKHLREPITEKNLNSWRRMYSYVNSTGGQNMKDKKINLVFHIMFLHMGFQLFREPVMAQTAILDLEKCMENAMTTKRKRSSIIGETESNSQPEWIEVIVDLFLHLLSQSTGFLRTIVNSVFPHLCKHLNLTAMYQILSVLDMKDGKNPLSQNGNGINGSHISDDDDDDEHDTDSDESDNKSESSDADDMNDEDEEELMEEEEGTVTDQLRNAISMALGSARPDTDTESIDLDDINETEAERLDSVLSDAFKINRKLNPKKKSKQERITETTLMHFRIRVLDLLDIYLKADVNLSICLEILCALFNMTEHCIDKNLQPLTVKLNKVMAKLLSIRQFGDVSNVTEDHLSDLLKSLLERKLNSVEIDNHNSMLAKSFAFIVNCSQIISTNTSSEECIKTVLGLSEDYINEFIKSRNPIISFVLLREIFKIRWTGIWHLGKILAKLGLSSGVRSFRRNQTLELLGIMYKNHGFISQDKDQFNHKIKSIEKKIYKYIANLTNVEHLSAKEFVALTGLLLQINKCHKMPSIQQKLDWSKVGEHIQQLRQRTNVTSAQTHSYVTLCRLLGLQILKTTENNKIMENRKNRENVNENDTESVSTLKRQKDTEPPESKKLKKLKKEERLRQASQGFNDSISFTTTLMDET